MGAECASLRPSLPLDPGAGNLLAEGVSAVGASGGPRQSWPGLEEAWEASDSSSVTQLTSWQPLGSWPHENVVGGPGLGGGGGLPSGTATSRQERMKGSWQD